MTQMAFGAFMSAVPKQVFLPKWSICMQMHQTRDTPLFITFPRRESYNTTRSGLILAISQLFGHDRKHCLNRLTYLLNRN